MIMFRQSIMKIMGQQVSYDPYQNMIIVSRLKEILGRYRVNTFFVLGGL